MDRMGLGLGGLPSVMNPAFAAAMQNSINAQMNAQMHAQRMQGLPAHMQTSLGHHEHIDDDPDGLDGDNHLDDMHHDQVLQISVIL
jgi:hypothetical protein